MTVLSVARPTLLDMAKAMDPDGKIADVVEIMNETNEMLEDMVGKRATSQLAIAPPSALVSPPLHGANSTAAFSRQRAALCRSPIPAVCLKRMRKLTRPLRTLMATRQASDFLRIALTSRAFPRNLRTPSSTAMSPRNQKPSLDWFLASTALPLRTARTSSSVAQPVVRRTTPPSG